MSDQDFSAYPRGRLQAVDLDLAASLQAMVQKEVIDKRSKAVAHSPRFGE